jgi:hypothetical protein
VSCLEAARGRRQDLAVDVVGGFGCQDSMAAFRSRDRQVDKRRSTQTGHRTAENDSREADIASATAATERALRIAV